MSRYQRSSLLTRIIAFSLLWLILSDGELDQWWFGAIFVALALAAIQAMDRNEQLVAKPLRFQALPSLSSYFLYLSFKGGIAVARAAFSPRAVRPFYTELPLHLSSSDSAARTTLAATMCLLPGTVSCRIYGDILLMHVLDEGMLDIDSIRRYERLIAALFVVPLEHGS